MASDPKLGLDISDLPPPPPALTAAPQLAAAAPTLDVSDLPAPPQAAQASLDVSDLPAPPGGVGATQSDVSELPAPPAAGESVPRQLLHGAENALSSVVDPSGKLGILDKDYHTRQRGGLELLSEMVTHLAAGRGMATAGGALIGTLFGPGPGTAAGAAVGNLLYSMYQGVGREISRSEAVGQDFSILRAGINSALELNPLASEGSAIVKAIGLGSKAGSAVRVVGQAALRGATEYSYTHDATAALTTGAVGMLMAYPMYRSIRHIDANLLPTEASVAATGRAMSGELGSDVLQRTAAKVAATASDAVDTTDIGFQRFVTGAADQAEHEVSGAFERLAAHFTPERLDSAWQGYRASKAFTESLTEVAEAKAKDLGGEILGLDVRKWQDSWKPLEFVASRVDRLWGTNLEGKLQGVAKAKEAFQVKAAGYFDEAVRIDKAARKLGLSREDVGRALDGQLESLAPDTQTKLTQAVLTDRDGGGQVSVLDGWRRLWQNARGEIKAAGYNIGEIQDYVPMRALRGVDLADRMQNSFTSLQRKAAAAGTTVLKLGDEEAQDFRAMAAKVLRKDAEHLTDGDLNAVAKLAMQQGKTVPTYTPSAVFDRLGEGVPDAYREYDVGKLFTGYINGNLKAVHFDTALQDIRTHITAFRAAGMPVAAQFFERYLGDVTGASARGLAGAMRDAGVSLRFAGRQLQGSDNPLARGLGQATEALPDFAAWANGLVYPSYLGLPNLHAPLRNMTQTILKTVPEIGWANGTKWWFHATAELAGDMKAAAAAGKNPFTHIEDGLKAAGLLGQHIMANMDAEPGMFTGAKAAVDQVNSKLMSLYSQTDTLNRALTAKMGNQWAKAVAAGDASAIKALDRLGPGMRAQLSVDGLDDTARLGHQLGDYLIGRTQFRYGKELQSDFGRTMGPLFTMFTKWPTMVTADILDGFGAGKLAGTREAVTKYLAPWGILYGVQHALTASNNHLPTAWQVYVGDLPSMTPFDMIIPAPVKAMLPDGQDTMGSSLDMLGGPGIQLGKEYIDTLSKAGNSNGAFKSGVMTGTRQLLKGYVPVVAPVLNELDRWSRAVSPHQATPTRELVNKALGQ